MLNAFISTSGLLTVLIEFLNVLLEYICFSDKAQQMGWHKENIGNSWSKND